MKVPSVRLCVTLNNRRFSLEKRCFDEFLLSAQLTQRAQIFASILQRQCPHFRCERDFCILQSAISCTTSPMGFGVSQIAFEEPSFWQRGPKVSVPNSSVVHIQKVVDGYWAKFILWAPDFGLSSRRWQSER